jgi:hypothetical protein
VATNGTLVATNYSFNFTNGALTVAFGTPAVTWSAPTNIVYGTALGLNQNNATSPVPGTAVYDPTNGVVLPAGTNTLHMAYTPTDTNFLATNLSATLVVTPASLTVTAGDTNKVYGQTVSFAGTEFSSSGLVNGDTVTNVTLTSSGAGTGAGVVGSPYAINVTNASGSGLANYTINYQPGILTVNPPTLTVTAADQTRMYAMTNPVLTASYSGFVNAEGPEVLLGSPDLSTTANPASLVGEYPISITQGTLSNANYSFLFTNGTLTVTSAPAPVIISIGLTNEVITVAWSSVAGALYGLQSSTNLTVAGWNDVMPNVTATDSLTSQTNAITDVPVQFFRVLLRPAGS